MENVGKEEVGRQVELAFGARVKELRQARGLTQEALAWSMTAAGYVMHQTTLAKIENGGRPTSVGELAALAMVFEVPIAELLTTERPSAYLALAGLGISIAARERELIELDGRRELLITQLSNDKAIYTELQRELDSRYSIFSPERIAFDHPTGEDI